jgi:hypothetical protein
MRALTATAVIGPDHVLTVQVPADILPGTREVVVVLPEEMVHPQRGFSLAGWPTHPVGLADPNVTFRREEMYGDDGR